MELRDPVSSASHLLTAIWAVYATLILIRLTPPHHARKLAVAVFGTSMVLLYLASGTFHGLHYESAEQRRFFQKIDQSAIFMLIAGTNTPILVILLGGRAARMYLSVLWGLAGVGIFCLWLLPKAPHWVMVANYMAIGWLGFLPAREYLQRLNWRCWKWVFYGTFWYSLGAICELTNWPVILEWPVRFAAHEVLHICDTFGSMSFFIFIARYVVPYGNPILSEEPVASDERECQPAFRSPKSKGTPIAAGAVDDFPVEC